MGVSEVEHGESADVEMDKEKIVVIVILLKKSHSKNQGKIFRSQKLCNARSELG